MVVWDRTGYILEAEKHLNGKRVYKEVKLKENILTGLVEKSNNIFDRLCSHRSISSIFPTVLRKQSTLVSFTFYPK